MSELGQLLFEHWDPISVNSNVNLADEYEDLVPELADFLSRRPTEIEVADWLGAAELDIHCPTNSEVRLQVARVLLAATAAK